MINYSPLPIWSEDNLMLHRGTFFEPPNICKTQNPSNCKKYYDEIRFKKGFHICPAGCSSYSTGDQNEHIYSGMRVSGYYNQKALKHQKTFLPTLPPEVVLESLLKIKQTREHQKNDSVNSNYDKELTDFCFHEIRKYNLTVKRSSEEYTYLNNKGNTEVEKLMKTIFSSSTSISSRLNLYDLESNPSIVTSYKTYNASVFGKFQKASHCLEIYARDASVKISPFKGTLKSTIDMYPIFEFVPHVLLENAVKYSPPDQEVSVCFEESNTSFSVTVQSLGPCVKTHELKDLFKKNFRGANAKTVDTGGGGYGLYFAKLICELHSLEIEAKSNTEMTKFNGIPYSMFTVKLSNSKYI
jgi:K+-sensing histidine kinase KdpD